MVKIVFASLVATAYAGACSADDQAALADAQTVGEKQDKCGKDALGLSGIDHDKFTSCVQSELSISSDCSECYYTVADYGFKNCKAACLLGWCKSGCLSCTQPAQDDLAGCTGFSPSTASPCLETTSTGACSADDQAAISDPDTIGKKAGDCGKSAYNIATGNFNHDKFNDCLTASAGISAGCSECYAVSGEYGAKNCKAACLLGWCKSGCLDCVQPAQADLDTCTGFTSGSATPCLSATGACSADDQANLADAKTVGDKQDKCGKDALGLSGIDHDKFTSCAQSELAISSGCAECYYAVADYGFKNCKAACLLGWCKEGCLSCTQPAQDTLAGCAGFTPSKAEPCLESKAGACSDDEKAAIQGLSAKDFGDKSNKCGTQALGLTGINHDKFNSCMKTEVGIDTACAECYAVTADYGFKNCKAACLLGWCKSGCLSCTQPAQDDLPACTGFAAGSADPCLDDVVV